jgi:Coenzyme PQQ synthesis protein D (PqqD)
MNDDVRQSASVRRFGIDGGLLLLNDRSKCLYAYNDTARHVWDLIEAGGAEDDWVSQFAQVWGISRARARNDIQAIVAQWHIQGMLVGSEHTAALVASGPKLAVAEWHCAHPQEVSEWTCTIRGTTIAFAIEGEMIAPIRLMLKQMETPGAAPQIRLELRRAASGEAVLLCDGLERIRTLDLGLLVGGLWQAILECIHPNVAWLALMHGAAVAHNGSGFALCGPSGSGKTTLAASLISNGFDYLADDLVALSAPLGTIVPWPTPLSIKPGSIEVITRYHDELARASSYPTKGVVARLLVPPSTVWDSEPVKLRCLVFPRFAAGAEPQLQRISSFQAIECLLTDRVCIGSPITADRVAVFLEWLDETPAYMSVYGNLGDGMRHIEDLVA